MFNILEFDLIILFRILKFGVVSKLKNKILYLRWIFSCFIRVEYLKQYWHLPWFFKNYLYIDTFKYETFNNVCLGTYDCNKNIYLIIFFISRLIKGRTLYEDNIFTLNLKITNTVVLYKIVSNKNCLSDRIFTIFYIIFTLGYT